MTANFWARVEPGPPDLCWEWTGTITGRGYGQIMIDGKKSGAHRYAIAFATGESIPTGKVVMHLCDNPKCCNPAHLQVGSHAENIADRDRKGRANTPFGERNGSAKLNEADVRHIRSFYKKSGLSMRKLAKQYGVSASQISEVVNYRTWIHVS